MADAPPSPQRSDLFREHAEQERKSRELLRLQSAERIAAAKAARKAALLKSIEHWGCTQPPTSATVEVELSPAPAKSIWWSFLSCCGRAVDQAAEVEAPLPSALARSQGSTSDRSSTRRTTASRSSSSRTSTCNQSRRGSAEAMSRRGSAGAQGSRPPSRTSCQSRTSCETSRRGNASSPRSPPKAHSKMPTSPRVRQADSQARSGSL